MNKVLRSSRIVYTTVSILIYMVVLYVLYGFYQRKLSSSDHYFNPSIIEAIKESKYQEALIINVVVIVALIILLWGLWKKKKVANVFFIIAFILQIAVTIFAGILLKDIEGVYFSKSPYVEKYFYFVWVISFITLWVMVDWTVLLFSKIKKKTDPGEQLS